MTKNSKRALAALAAVIIAFSVIAFILPLPKNNVFWVSYLFGIISVAVQAYVLKIAFHDAICVKNKFYGFPIAKIGIIYMITQLLFSLIAIVLAQYIPIWVVVVVFVFMFCATFIGIIGADAARDEIERQDKKHDSNIQCIQELRSKVYSLIVQMENVEAQKVLSELSEAFKYSDPVSNDCLADIENELHIMVDELKKHDYEKICEIDSDIQNVKILCKKISTTLTERNRLCKLNKVH